MTGVKPPRRRHRMAFGPAADAHRLVHGLANAVATRTARAILADIGAHLGSGMGSFVNIFEPRRLVIGGGFGIAAWEWVIPAAEEIMHREALRPMRDEVRVVRAELGTAAGLIGAAFVAFESARRGVNQHALLVPFRFGAAAARRTNGWSGQMPPARRKAYHRM